MGKGHVGGRVSGHISSPAAWILQSERIHVFVLALRSVQAITCASTGRGRGDMVGIRQGGENGPFVGLKVLARLFRNNHEPFIVAWPWCGRSPRQFTGMRDLRLRVTPSQRHLGSTVIQLHAEALRSGVARMNSTQSRHQTTPEILDMHFLESSQWGRPTAGLCRKNRQATRIFQVRLPRGSHQPRSSPSASREKARGAAIPKGLIDHQAMRVLSGFPPSILPGWWECRSLRVPRRTLTCLCSTLEGNRITPNASLNLSTLPEDPDQEATEGCLMEHVPECVSASWELRHRLRASR